MKKMLAYVVALGFASLPLMACSSDDSPAASEQSSAREVSMSFKGCYENFSKKVSLLKESSEDLPLAYLYNENGQYRLMIPKMDDYCGFDKVTYQPHPRNLHPEGSDGIRQNPGRDSQAELYAPPPRGNVDPPRAPARRYGHQGRYGRDPDRS